MDLKGVRLPAGYTGVGLHDSPGVYMGAWGYEESLAHAQMLRSMGVTLYKLFTDGQNKVERARAYVDAGVLPIIRPWIVKPWGRGLPVTPGDQLAPYMAGGVQMVELGNEWNIDEEWSGGRTPNARAVAVEVANWWEVCLQRASEVEGMIPVFPSNTPGGSVPHRLCYAEIIHELGARGLLGTVEHIAIHPRPHNNPPDVKWSPSNTVTWDEWRWIRDAWLAVGVDAVFWATEHGYSVGSSENAEYPPITLDLHTAYNRELQVRMDPAHPEAIEPEMAGHMHWYEAGWGHWGPWPKDALRDSVVPEMPAPSPLWTEMGLQPLAFERYSETPPPPDEPAWGVDVSYAQPSFDWDAFEGDFAFIRVGKERTLDSACFRHDNRSPHLQLRGGYHYLVDDNNPWRQARYAAALQGHLGWPLPFAVDVEANGLSVADVRHFVERWYELTDHPLMIYSSPGYWSRFGGLLDDLADVCDLWVAHWDVEAPELFGGWTKYLFWQKGQQRVLGWHTKVDVNESRLTVADLRARYLDGPEPPPPDDDIAVYDAQGQVRDLDWLRGRYGPFQIKAESLPAWKIVALRERVNTHASLVVQAAPGTRVAWYWPDAPEDPECGPAGGVLPGMRAGRAVSGTTSPAGDVGFAMGGGAYYDPSQGQIGPHAVWIYGAETASDVVLGLGMVAGTNHDHVDVDFAWVE